MSTPKLPLPERLLNWIAGEQRPSSSERWFAKHDPATGRELLRAADSSATDVDAAVTAARDASAAWSRTPGVRRGLVLHGLVRALQDRQQDIARVVAAETGKSYKDALGETGGAIALGLFFASEGQRLYGRTTTSGTEDRWAMTVRQPIGVAGLIVPANTPIANLAWKIFPALVCGNTAVVKSAEDTPGTAWLFGQLAHDAGIPAGVLNIVHGFGASAGAPLVAHPDVGVISFTGSTAVGRTIQRVAGERLARVSLELGGKNPFVVCDDADLDHAARWAALSAFSNAGQRCAAASRIIVFDAVYDAFRERLLAKTASLRVGTGDDDDLGPVINERQLAAMLQAIERARAAGATVIAGGNRLTGPAHAGGYYLAPTVLEHVDPNGEASNVELFGPITALYRVRDFSEALALANHTPYGLTACIHTRDLNRALEFANKVQAGVAMVNAGTYGSEPHMPFGGRKQSGNGTREPGTEALDVYSELKDIYVAVDPSRV